LLQHLDLHCGLSTEISGGFFERTWKKSLVSGELCRGGNRVSGVRGSGWINSCLAELRRLFEPCRLESAAENTY